MANFSILIEEANTVTSCSILIEEANAVANSSILIEEANTVTSCSILIEEANEKRELAGVVIHSFYYYKKLVYKKLGL